MSAPSDSRYEEPYPCFMILNGMPFTKEVKTQRDNMTSFTSWREFGTLTHKNIHKYAYLFLILLQLLNV